ncbi:MAG: hypothetical protein JST68_22520 [Bacteroidetes bacterium]|nr:hypothetical protein [Bacteroidota bacterium]
MGDRKKLEKLIIRSFTDRQFQNERTDLKFVAPINPETFTKNFKVSVDQQQGHGNEGTEIRYRSTAPEEFRLEFILDGTRTMEGYSGKTSDYITKPVTKQLQDFLDCAYYVDGGIHRPNFLIVMWGSDVKFRCVLANVDINYTLFEPDGSPLRVKINATFLHHKSREEILAESKLTSPDLTHYRKVTQGDRLDNMTYNIYNDPGFLSEVGAYNGLTTVRRLKPGVQLSFPPLIKLSSNG